MMNIPESYRKNQAFEARPLAFNRQAKIAIGRHVPGEKGCIGDGAVIREDGSVDVTMIAVGAQHVEAGNYDMWVELADDGRGVWTGNLPYKTPGFQRILFRVDGIEVLNPLAPIGFGDNRHINYVDIPEEDAGWMLLKDVPHGSFTREYYKSTVTGEYECCLVYTPPYYQEEPEKKYPVLYLQHGGGENETVWAYQGKINYIVDNLLAEKKAEPCIIVMNSGMVQVKVDGEWEQDDDYMQDLIIQDCIPFIESRYRVLPGKENRAYAGLSMGSLQGARFIMERPEVFSYAGLFTGFLAPRHHGIRPQPYLKALDDAETFNNNIKVFFRAMGEQEASIPLFEEETALCEEKGIHYIARTYPGRHEWRVWRRAIKDFLELIFR